MLSIAIVLFYPIDQPLEPHFIKQEAPTLSNHQSSSWQNMIQTSAGGGFSTVPSGSFFSHTSPSAISRSRSAAQIVRRGDNRNDASDSIAMGTSFAARLLNTLSSTSGSQPVIAELVEASLSVSQSNSDFSDPNGVFVSGARVIGSATFDEQHHRIQVRFSTIISPDGEQRTIQALAMMLDGSSGLVADYSSPEIKRQAGNLLNHFVAGMAGGMKDRVATGLFGEVTESGSIKNGVLSGIAQSANDNAREFSENLSHSQGTLSLQAGQVFLIYLEKEFP